MRARTIIIAASVALTALALAAAANAGQRTKETFTFSDPFTGSFSCGTFTATFSGRDHGRVTTWFDSNGEPILQEGHVEATETDVNTATGKSIDVSTRFNVHVDFQAETMAISGVRNLSTEPGAGVVVQHVGRVLVTLDFSPISLSGKYPEFVEGYMSEDWCAALA
jgi:hypothetical protein